MDKVICCDHFEIGCTFTACTGTGVEFFEKILQHGRTVHRAEDFSPDVYGKVRAPIKEGYCDLEDALGQYGECCWQTKENHLRASSITKEENYRQKLDLCPLRNPPRSYHDASRHS